MSKWINVYYAHQDGMYSCVNRMTVPEDDYKNDGRKLGWHKCFGDAKDELIAYLEGLRDGYQHALNDARRTRKFLVDQQASQVQEEEA